MIKKKTNKQKQKMEKKMYVALAFQSDTIFET